TTVAQCDTVSPVPRPVSLVKAAGTAVAERTDNTSRYAPAKNASHGTVVARVQGSIGEYSFLPAPVRDGHQSNGDVIEDRGFLFPRTARISGTHGIAGSRQRLAGRNRFRVRRWQYRSDGAGRFH